MLPDKIGVTPIEARIPVIRRWSDTERLLAERVGELVFELKTESRREAPDSAQLELVRYGVAARLVNTDGSNRLERTSRLNLSRSRRRIVDVKQPLELSAFHAHVRGPQRRVS